MDRLLLRHTVEVSGFDIKGRKSLLVISPNKDATGWQWKVDVDEYIPITPDILTSLPRRAALVYGRHRFDEFEHVGFLRAAGLQHVNIWMPDGNTWPPYDGGALALWQAVMPHTYRAGELKPFCLRVGETQMYNLPSDRSRGVSYLCDNKDKTLLRITGNVHFPKIDPESYNFSFDYGRDDLLTLVRARTLGWPPNARFVALALDKCRPLLRRFGRDWPHYERILWPNDKASPEEVLNEIGSHRMFDALSVLNFLAPDDTHLVGTLHSSKGNHATDVALLKKASTPKVVRFSPVSSN
jgi:hypothetical protein